MSACGGQSISYKDGYVEGTSLAQTVAGDVTTWCQSDAAIAMPTGDNQGDWVQGCIDGWNHELYLQAHPGAGPSGASG